MDDRIEDAAARVAQLEPVRVGRHTDEPRPAMPGRRLADLTGRRSPVDQRHVVVEDREIVVLAAQAFEGLETVGRQGHGMAPLGQDMGHDIPREDVVVGDQDLQRHVQHVSSGGTPI